MNHRNCSLLSFAFLAIINTSTWADVIISEKFTGSASTDLVGTPTPDGNNWKGAEGEAPSTGAILAPKFSIKQDGSVGGVAFTAYHKFTLKPGQMYTLEALICPSNKADNQWFTVGFCLTAQDGDAAPHQDGGRTFGQLVLSGSGYRYGWTGPNINGMSELTGPGLHSGSVKVVLDTSDSKNYTIELFDGSGKSLHGPKSIGTPAISQVFLGSSGTDGRFKSLTLSDDADNSEPATEE